LGTEYIDAEGMEPIKKIPEYVPPHKGKVKVTKDPNSDKLSISTPLLPKKVPLEGLWLARILLLKMEDWDLADHARFPHLETDKYMKHVYYVKSGVTTLGTVEWICSVENSGLLNLLWVPHYHHTPINTICVRQLLTLVHDGCLWLGGHIPITDMIIHTITQLPYDGLNPAKEFGRKTGEKDMAERMKKEFDLMNKA